MNDKTPKAPVITENITFSYKLVISLGVAVAVSVTAFVKLTSRVKSLENNSKAIAGMEDTLAEILTEQRIQTALQRAKLTDRWTAAMEKDIQRQWEDWVMTVHPDQHYSDFPSVDEVQRRHLAMMWDEIKAAENDRYKHID